MNPARQIERAQRLLALHDRKHVLLLPNAWDAGSARLFDELGFAAIATTSGGMAWSLGHADGEQLPLADILAATRRIVGATQLPVTVDFEGGHGATPEAVAANVRALIDTGIAGLNLEDGIEHRSLRDIDDASARIAAARAAAQANGVPIVINARVDVWMVGGDASDDVRFADAIVRARRYLAAGADCIYPIGLADPAMIERFIAALDAPVNVGARVGLPDIAELKRIGVARVSSATRLATIAYSAARAAAVNWHVSGRCDGLDAPFGYADMQGLFD
ncbi:MAG: isocitrate lyase/phosphoenolpyruvate mutase family protein [Dokdonella sp.]|uniref:isocitrate lyase/PEP mutase family protein n=1 Tax=Dokdonella sp. TaxID=2291710 RepID=UPI0025B817FC|nr:isocitrate lyase/phosphoenolpyruvate mutase family protein [Dokdonella sp.]MBZ0221980.1 isocitrate lyase/phosphoenolpyruvate mutase family protein [Dokdonella sp.]MCC7254541.1 isocitrate lyase/phosphoenolpyruvate mutase family protein [Dokdonella sp.]